MKGAEKSNLTAAVDRLLRPCLLFATSLILGGLLLGVLVPRGHLMYVWPVTGVQLALLLSSRQQKGRVILEVIAAAGATLVVCLGLHVPILTSLLIASNQAAELLLLLRVLRGHVGYFDDLKTRARVLRFFFAAILVPSLAAVASPFLNLTHLSRFQVWTGVALSDSLGIVVFTPTLLFLLSGRLWRKDQAFYRFRAGVGASALFLGVVIAIFLQSKNPFLFLIYPPLVIVVFVLGVRGAIFASLAATVIACWATATGHGPIWIAHNVTMEHRIFVLQILLWSIVGTGLPIGSLLDEQRASEEQAHKNRTIYETLIENSEDMIVLARLDGSSRFVSPAVEQVTGWTPAQYLALPALGSVHEADRDLSQTLISSLSQGKTIHTIRYRLLHSNGGFGWVEAFIRGYADVDGGPITGYVATIRDITALKETEESWSAEKHALASQNEQLADLAAHDELTGLPNRRAFNQSLNLKAAGQSRSSDSLSLLMIDVDSFKKFNDRYGHQAGDVCLQKVASVFKECAARSHDLAARVGGEEFAVLLPHTDEAGASLVANAILERVRGLQLIHEDSLTGCVSVSIGISTWQPFESSETAELIQQADRALYESKRTGRNRMTLWNGARELVAHPVTI